MHGETEGTANSYWQNAGPSLSARFLSEEGDVARDSRGTLQSEAGRQLIAPMALMHSQDLGLLRQGKWW